MAERRKQDQRPISGIERRKGPRRRDLSRALGEYVMEFEKEKTERLTLEEKNRVLETERYTDSLTGLANRRSFDEKLPELVDIANRNGEPLALMFVDCNDLHGFNKVHGHAAGDEFIKWTAHTIRDLTRPTDLVARNGGDEFAVVFTGFKPLPGVSEKELFEDTEKRFKDALGDRATIGIATLRPDETYSELFNRADTANSAAKPPSSRSPDRLAS